MASWPAAGIFETLASPPWPVVAGEKFEGQRRRHRFRPEVLGVGLLNHFLQSVRFRAVPVVVRRCDMPQQVATITGHSLKTVFQILERYLARTSGLAEQAIKNFENSTRTKFANQLQTTGARGTKANEKDIESQ